VGDDAELERAGRAALGRPVTAQAERIRVETVSGSGYDGATTGRENGRPRTPEQIEAEIERARAQLAGTLDEIVDRVKPANVARRTGDQVRAQFVDPDTGQPRMERILPIAGGALGLVMIVVALKRRGRRK
jgi:hypothetical protein